MKFSLTYAAVIAVLLVAGATAANAKDYTITLKNNEWQPQNLEVIAGEKIKLTVKNETDKAAEFESDALDREKVVAAHDTIIITLEPLKAGVYPFDNDFHEDTKGTITAK